MKKLILLLLLIGPLLSNAQVLKNSGEYHRKLQNKFAITDDEYYLLDSIRTHHILSGDTIRRKLFTYYIDGKIKTYKDVCYTCNWKMTADKESYKYDEAGRVNELIIYEGDSELNWTPTKKTTNIWFDDEYISESVTFAHNGSDWEPVKKEVSPDLGQPDYFTTYIFSWDAVDYEWDTTSKITTHFNNNSLIDTIYTYSKVQGVWSKKRRTTNEYTSSGKIKYTRFYTTSDNGITYQVQVRYEYQYYPEGLLRQFINRQMTWEQWYREIWYYDEQSRIEKYYYYKMSPAHPEEQGGIVHQYIYNDLGNIDYREVYAEDWEYHFQNEYYYYTKQTVDVEEFNSTNTIVYPNPFTTSTTISYDLSHPSTVQITIFNHLGKQVGHIQQNQPLGKQQITWDASGLPSGVYYFRMQAGDQVSTGKLLLVK